MRREVFTVPYPRNMSAFCKRFGLNAYWSGKHWGQRKSDAEYMHRLVWTALSDQGIPRKPFKKPVRIKFQHNDRMDIDNHAAIEKMIVDALKGWLIENDSRKYYAERTSVFYDGDGIRVVVEERR